MMATVEQLETKIADLEALLLKHAWRHEATASPDPLTAASSGPVHARYTNAEAIAAVEGEPTLDLSGTLSMAGDTNFVLLSSGGDRIFQFDTKDYFAYQTSTNTWTFFIASLDIFSIDATGLLVNNIDERLSGAGVTIETVPIKDGEVDGIDISAQLPHESYIPFGSGDQTFLP